MSYKNKLFNYQEDCSLELGKYEMFSDYIKHFSLLVTGYGLDIGAGPGGCNGKYFQNLDGCDADSDVIQTLPDYYTKKFIFVFGKDILPYQELSLNFIILSCIIQHLNDFKELEHGIHEVSRILKKDGHLSLMFKAGSNDTLLTHFNDYYKEVRTFRVFHPDNVKKLCSKYSLQVLEEEELLDSNFIPYCCLTLKKE